MSGIKHALIIDDDAFNLEVLKRRLVTEELFCTAVQDVHALDPIFAQVPQIDIVFLDLEMPHMDGYTVYRDTNWAIRFLS